MSLDRSNYQHQLLTARDDGGGSGKYVYQAGYLGIFR